MNPGSQCPGLSDTTRIEVPALNIKVACTCRRSWSLASTPAPTAEMTRFVDAHRERFGVEPICRALQAAPSTCCPARTGAMPTRLVHDEALKLRQVR